MGGYYFCGIPKARRPYLVESTGLHLWSIEELCYYMKENVYLLDETILNEGLARWLGGELGLEKLQKALLHALEAGTPSDFVDPIFEECGYLPPEEFQKFQDAFAQVQIESKDVRKKMKADYLVGYGMYIRAIGEYKSILKNRAPGRLGIQFYAVVLQNMAAAYAHLFRFEEAADCLWESYSLLKSRKVYENYLRLLPLFLSERRYYERLEQIHADRDHAAALREDVAAIFEEAQSSRFAQEWDSLADAERLEKLKADYVACT